jgi:hypothetical protein
VAELRELYLSDNNISDAGAQALTRSRPLRPLELLCLRFNPISPSAAASLRQHFGKAVHFS